MSDCIDRQTIINLLTSRAETLRGLYGDLGDAASGVRKLIQTLPSVQPEQKKGEWMMNSDYPDRLICSECARQFDVWHWESKQMHFCPNCGADMRG